MTVLTQPRPGDTGEFHVPADEPTVLIRPAHLPAAPDPGESTTRLQVPAMHALLAVDTPRRPAADTTGEILYRADLDVPATVADLDARLVGPGTQRPPVPLPAPTPPPIPAGVGDAQKDGYVGHHRFYEPTFTVYPTPIPAYAEPEPVEDEEPELDRRWPNRLTRFIDWMTLRNLRGAR
jgi:hypothetical protein